LQQERQVASAKHHALDSHNFALDAKENHIPADDSQSRLFANLRTKPVNQGILPNAANLVAYFLNKLYRAC
jgi:hypothetical protein